MDYPCDEIMVVNYAIKEMLIQSKNPGYLQSR